MQRETQSIPRTGEEARRTISVPVDRRQHIRQRTTGVVNVPKMKGHDVILKALRENGCTLWLVTLAGEAYSGKIVGSDKYTITLETQVERTEDGITGEVTVRMVFYKHAIESFYSFDNPTKDRQQ